ncbi:MAG: DUF6932 family protein [Planctomycetota bacterium]
MIPGFRKDGYSPDGIHLAELDEIVNCFGTTQRRSKLMSRVRTWVGLARSIRARRLLLAGSFVTSKPDPTDVDAVVLLPDDFSELVDQGIHDALELSTMLISRHPEEIFAAEDERDWYNWVDFFSRTRELDGRSKGIIEVKL